MKIHGPELCIEYRDPSTGLELNPEDLEKVRRYVEDGAPLLGFLRAVACNDLAQASILAAGVNRLALTLWGWYFHNHVPGNAWGNDEKLAAWERARQSERETTEQ